MNDTNNGGLAFPILNLHHDADFNGMTLRDYFAAKAMHALVVEPPWDQGGTATVHHWSE